jgi:mono/diheme cytochrome c family protein
MLWRSFAVFCGMATIMLAQQGAVTDQMRRIWPNLPPNQNPVEVARGKALFESNCSFCHGPEATGGNGGPDLVRSVLVNHDEHGNLIGPTIRNGRIGKGMPAFPNFSDAQINDIVAFLHQRNRDARIRVSYRIGDVETGNAAAGKTFFSAHCASCHSPQGDLAGIAGKYDPDQLQQLWLDPAQQLGSQRGIPAETVTVTLPSGERLTGTLKHLDEFDVSLYDANGYHSFPITPGVRVKVDNPAQAHEDLLKHLTDADIHNVTTYLGTLK